MTKESFLVAYQLHIEKLPWASNADKLARFLQSARNTIDGTASTWHYDGPSTVAAWRDIGGKGKPTLKALRALQS